VVSASQLFGDGEAFSLQEIRHAVNHRNEYANRITKASIVEQTISAKRFHQLHSRLGMLV
jgi:hypothetical protein